MTEPEGPAHPEPPNERLWLRAALAVVVAAVVFVVGFFAAVLLAFGLLPTCETSEPPGPPVLDVALLVLVALCVAAPVLVAGRRLRLLGWPLGIVAALVPGVGLAGLLTQSNSGFCF